LKGFSTLMLPLTVTSLTPASLSPDAVSVKTQLFSGVPLMVMVCPSSV
jgi:hypothetical protein